MALIVSPANRRRSTAPKRWYRALGVQARDTSTQFRRLWISDAAWSIIKSYMSKGSFVFRFAFPRLFRRPKKHGKKFSIIYLTLIISRTLVTGSPFILHSRIVVEWWCSVKMRDCRCRFKLQVSSFWLNTPRHPTVNAYKSTI